MVKYKKVELKEEPIKHLYISNEWTNYTNNMPALINGIKNSLFTLGAYDQEKLVGLIRVVGDGETIVYVQDILIDPSYQRLGIGRTLMDTVLDKYKQVRQIVLITDKTEKQASFYQALGFKKFDALDIVGFYYIRK